jgi:hypothetical protein
MLYNQRVVRVMQINIDPVKLGELEVSWWRAHHEHNKPEMAQLLIEQNVVMYGFTPNEAKAALRLLVAGVNYHDTREWEKAIDAVERYYKTIKYKTDLGFNPRKLAELEVGWWQLHDKLEFNPDKSQLARAFANLYASLYSIDLEKMFKAGELKAEATHEHDLAEDPNTPSNEIDKHWNKAKKLLIEFYVEIKKVVVCT